MTSEEGEKEIENFRRKVGGVDREGKILAHPLRKRAHKRRRTGANRWTRGRVRCPGI